MRNTVSFIVLVVACLGLYREMQVLHAGPSKLTSDPAQIELLKKQAAERRTFYAEQAREQSEFKKAQLQEQHELLEKHREARKVFSSKTQTAQSRADFYRGQRDEMGKLKAEQQKAKRELDRKLKQKLDEFHAEQKKQQHEAKIR